jgi:hypothetical protein
VVDVAVLVLLLGTLVTNICGCEGLLIEVAGLVRWFSSDVRGCERLLIVMAVLIPLFSELVLTVQRTCCEKIIMIVTVARVRQLF